MDQGTRQASQVDTGGNGDRTPEEIQREIDETRAELGDTVEALAHRADVKSRAKERIEEIKASAQQKKDEFASKAKAQAPDGASAGAQQLSAKAQQNPLPFAVGGALLAGFVLGRLTSS
jgi:chromosome segregation ATPase